MNFIIESYASFTFALVTFSLTITQGHSNGSCFLFQRPHPQGLCGQKLALAHRNLCIYVQEKFPLLFPHVKRSVPSSRSERSLDSSSSSLDTVSTAPPKTLLHSVLIARDGPDQSDNQKRPANFAGKFGQGNGRSKRSLVCECCFQACTLFTIAQYC